VRGPQKPFVVEVKRGRKNSDAQRSISWPQPKEPVFSAAAARRQVVPHTATPKEPAQAAAQPQRRILEAIEPEPAVNPTAARAANVDKPVRRRGRPAKGPRPAAVSREETHASRVSEATGAKVEKAAVAAPPLGAAKHVGLPGRVAPGGRGASETDLPRGQRWKRRLPKVLW